MPYLDSVNSERLVGKVTEVREYVSDKEGECLDIRFTQVITRLRRLSVPKKLLDGQAKQLAEGADIEVLAEVARGRDGQPFSVVRDIKIG